MSGAQSGPYREMYPEIEPFDSGFLPVSKPHEIYYEQSGCKDGKPVLFLHWGPGGNTTPWDRRFFDPSVYRIVIYNQRGAGKSRPAAELKDNNTWELIKDIEALREYLKIDKWVVFGGSWGSTMSLLYAETHPDRVKALILRGIFNMRRKELVWYFQEGASRVYPDHYENYIAPIPPVERFDLMGAYYRRLTGDDEETQLRCARSWTLWEMATSTLFENKAMLKLTESDEFVLRFARIECHYFVNGGFFERDEQILEDAYKIKHIPCTIVHGRYDIACPMDTAWELKKRLPDAEFHIVTDAGHAPTEPGITSLLLDATDKYKTL